MTAPTKQEMMERAHTYVGAPLRVVLVGLSLEDQIRVLIELASALACMNTAQALTYGLAQGSLYEEAGRAAASMLADFVSGAGLAGHLGEG